MRFESLRIPAFGPFTNLELTFSAKGGDFHIIYGPNEAGKSSLLRAYRDLFYGIPGQSSDDFIHGYKELRIAATIANQAGSKLEFQRRKGNQNTLMDSSNNPLQENVLIPFLGSVNEQYFSSMFGLGSKELRDGAEQLLQGQGNLGNALFSASMGGTPIQHILVELKKEAELLFKGRSTSNVTIRPAVNNYKQFLNESKKSVVSPEEWTGVEVKILASIKSKDELTSVIAESDNDIEWLTRCVDALPIVGELGERNKELNELPHLPEVTSDFVERAKDARKADADSRRDILRITEEVATLEKQIKETTTAPALILNADRLDKIHQELGVYRSHNKTLTECKINLAKHESSLASAMLDLELKGEIADIEKVRITTVIRLACEAAANELTGAQRKNEIHNEKSHSLISQLRALETTLSCLADTDLTSLRDLLALAAAATESDSTLPTAESEYRRLARATETARQELSLASTEADAAERLPVPSTVIIRETAEKMAKIELYISTEQDKIVRAKHSLITLQEELARLERRGELPTEFALQKSREHRDWGWSLVLADWKGKAKGEEFVVGMPLEDSFPQAMSHADSIADKLRFEAESVAQAEEKRTQIIRIDAERYESEGKVADLESSAKELWSAWEGEWKPCRIIPKSPAVMEDWRETWVSFKDILANARIAEESYTNKKNKVEECVKLLAKELDEDNKEGELKFTVLFDRVKLKVQQGEQAQGQRKALLNQLDDLKKELLTVEETRDKLLIALSLAESTWKKEAKRTGLPENISPQMAMILLQARKDLLATFDTWRGESQQRKSIEEAIDHYEQNVSTEALAFGAFGDSTENKESALHQLLTDARKSQTRYDLLEDQLAEKKTRLEEVRTSACEADNELKEILKLAKIESVDELEPLLANLEKQNSVKSKIAVLRNSLTNLARGLEVDDFIDRVNEEDKETLTVRKNTLTFQKREKEELLDAERSILHELREEQKEFEENGDSAAFFRQQAESCAAGLKVDAARFVRLRMAVYFLETQIEQFRKENQGPLLEKSGKFFNAMTLGAFSGLGADFSADDNPILVGLRPNDQPPVSIEGMSEGSRDQLYLALRLAALEQYLEKHEPVPLILDDLLITFDDQRAKAVLQQLSALAQRTQIFLFTHHAHILELCRTAVQKDSFHLHKLAGKGNGDGC